MNEKLQSMHDAFKANSESLYISQVFDSFVDNQINEGEVRELLDAENETLPESFSSLSIGEKKSYYSYKKRLIYYDGDRFKCEEKMVFNNPYFYKLVEQAKRNKTSTENLIKYLSMIGNENINLMFLGMQNVKVEYTKILQNDYLKDYAKNNNIKDCYELLTSIYSKSIGKNVICLTNPIPVSEIKRAINRVISSIASFNLDLDKPFVEFALYMERIGSSCLM